MRITKTVTPGAILPNDREGPVTFDARGALVLSRNNAALYLENINGFIFKNFTFFMVWEGSRIVRFLKVIPAVWRFCK